ncbi:MAG: ABC transporter ATP-binding protein [Rhizobiales bacterium]|nr:ABC transporter ATP-binding protein [Hyphomicrobiales bacterium]
MPETLLEVRNLRVGFEQRGRMIEAVRGVSFAMGREKLGIVGESGSGKSQTGRAILGLTDGRVEAEALRFRDMDLLKVDARTRRALRGGGIGMVMQDPKFSLNPVMRVGSQLVEALRAHERVSKSDARRRALAMLEAVQIDDPERVFGAYPHELSGGMGQRAMIAMMLLPDPDLLIADEPTSALDVTVQQTVLRIMDRLVQERGMGLILISHDLELVATFCDRILVMYAGRIVETLDADRLHDAEHPYTQGLMACLPSVRTRGRPLRTMLRDPAWLDAEARQP